MSRIRAIGLVFPTGGLDKKRSFEQQPPFTTPDALNVWSVSSRDGRVRGGSRAGTAKALSTQIGGGNAVNMLAKVAFIDSSGQRQNALVAAANGQLWKRTSGTTFTQVTSDLTIASDVAIHATDHLQKLYIADYSSNPLIGTDGTVAADGVTFDSASFTDWVASGVNKDDFVVEVRDSGTGTSGIYAISSVTSDTITLASSPGSSLTGVHFSVERSPKVYDPDADTLTRWTADANSGTVPLGNPAITTWRDRVALAGTHNAPHNWYLSRAGNAHNFDFGAGDALSATAGTNSDAGQLGEPVTALIPHQSDCMIMGGENTTWAMRGNPAHGGSIDNLSYRIGILNQGSWAKTADDRTILLSRDGLYMIDDPCGNTPQALSRQKLPDAMLDIDLDSVRPLLAYSRRYRGLLIALGEPSGASPAEHFWFDLETGAFWPFRFGSHQHDPMSINFYESLSSADKSDLLWGGKDGHVRQLDRSATSDDGVTFDSRVLIGPISMMGSTHTRGVVDQVQGALSKDSASMKWSIQTGKTHEEAVNARTFKSGQWEPSGIRGLQPTSYPKAGGMAFALKLEDNAAGSWFVEEISVIAHGLGRRGI